MSPLKLPKSVLTLDSIEPSIRDRARVLFKSSGSKGQIIGIIPVTFSLSELRLVTIVDGDFYVTRFSSKRINQRPDHILKFSQNLDRLQNIQYWLEYGTTSDSGSSGIWIRRPLVKETLTEIMELPFERRLKIAKEVINQIYILHQNGIVQGNLNPSNIGLQDSKVFLLDASLKHENLDNRISELDDVYGLGLVLSKLIAKGEVTSSRIRLINLALNSSPELRPKIKEFNDAFCSQTKEEQYIPYILFAALILSVLSFTFYYGSNNKQNYQQQSNNITVNRQFDYSENWASGQPGKMRKVALEAINNNKEAKFTIIKTVLKNKKTKFVDTKFIKQAFSDDFRKLFTEKDENDILEFGLRELILERPENFIWKKEVNPVIILIDILMNGFTGREKEYDLKTFSKIPGEVGELISSYKAINVALSNKLIESLFKVIFGNENKKLSSSDIEKDIKVLIAPDSKKDYVLSTAKIIFKFLKKNNAKSYNSDVINKTWEVIVSNKNFVNEAKWFSRALPEIWTDSNIKQKVNILEGKVPSGLSNLMLSDLVFYLSTEVKKNAAAKLANKIDKSPGALRIFKFFDQTDKFFKREQFVTLVSLIEEITKLEKIATDKVKNKFNKKNRKATKIDGIISEWFEVEPPIEGVIELLVVFSHRQDLDSLFLASGNYILAKAPSENNFELPLEKLRSLVGHPEPLVRTFAYQMLSPMNKSERVILEQAATIEPVKHLKDALISRLEAKTSVK